MPRQGLIYDIFLSSPNDTSAERDVVEKIVAELAREFANDSGLALNLLRWETTAIGGIGSEPQDVVDQSITKQYDLYIGIVWARMGTPTARARSGTEEEFDRAISRLERGDTSLDIAFFFNSKDVPIGVDTDQINQVRRFKEKINSKSILTIEYNSIEKFEQEIRRHIRGYAARQAAAYVQGSRHDGPGWIVAEKLIGMLRLIVRIAGEATHGLVKSLPDLARDPQRTGMLLSQFSRRAKTVERELRRASAAVDWEMRTIAADWILHPSGREEICGIAKLVSQEIGDIRRVLSRLLTTLRAIGTQPVNAATAIGQHERLVTFAVEAVDACERDLSLMVNDRRQQ
jgi:hypothetical protein